MEDIGLAGGGSSGGGTVNIFTENGTETDINNINASGGQPVGSSCLGGKGRRWKYNNRYN